MSTETKKNEAALNKPPQSNQASEWIHSTDVQEMVNAAVAKATEGIVARLADASIKADAAPGENDGELKFARALALEMARIADQGTGRVKRLDPEEQVRRETARQRMSDLLVETRQRVNEGSSDKPLYELRHKVYLEEILVDPIWIDNNHTQQPTQIEWLKEPNEVMRPLNEPAKAIHAAFMESLGNPNIDLNANLRVTPGGLVVIGSARQEVERPHVGSPQQSSDLAIRGRHRTGKMVNVLGTVAPAAEQSL